MNDIYLYGLGKNGKEIFNRYIKGKEEIAGFIDRKLAGENYCGYKVFSLEEIDIESSIVITLEDGVVIKDIYFQLRENGFKKIYYYSRNAKNEFDEDLITSKCIKCEDWGDTVLPHAEMHVSDYCNLNCKGCTHYSPIFERKLPDKRIRLKDVETISKKFSHVVHFNLLGGEPFLNPDIVEYIEFSRKCLPNSLISVVTNGLLIPSLDQSVFDAIRNNNIHISISEYEPTHRIINQIKKRLDDNDIYYTIRSYDRKKKFNKPLQLEIDEKREKLCLSATCTNIYDGKIARCPSLMYIDELNKKYGTAFPNEGIMELNECDASHILTELQREVPLCNYCVKNEIEWGRCGNTPQLEDFAD